MEWHLGEWHPVCVQRRGRESDHGVGRGRGRQGHCPREHHEGPPGLQVQALPGSEVRHAGIQTAEVETKMLQPFICPDIFPPVSDFSATVSWRSTTFTTSPLGRGPSCSPTWTSWSRLWAEAAPGLLLPSRPARLGENILQYFIMKYFCNIL